MNDSDKLFPWTMHRHEVRDPNTPKNAELYATIATNYMARKGPCVGDFVHMLDGTTRRFTYNCGDAIQTTLPGWDQSFNVGTSGGVSFSGSLDLPISKTQLEQTSEQLLGTFWFFDQNWPRARAAIHVLIPCRVFRQLERTTL